MTKITWPQKRYCKANSKTASICAHIFTYQIKRAFLLQAKRRQEGVYLSLFPLLPL